MSCHGTAVALLCRGNMTNLLYLAGAGLRLVSSFLPAIKAVGAIPVPCLDTYILRSLSKGVDLLA